MEASNHEIVPGNDIDDQVAYYYNNTTLTAKEIAQVLGVGYSRVVGRISALHRQGLISWRREQPTP
jgi:DNA-binding MarR family transcriptional regulator